MEDMLKEMEARLLEADNLHDEDIPAILDLFKIPREDFMNDLFRGIGEKSEEFEIINTMKKYPDVYSAIGPGLDSWYNLTEIEQRDILGKAYDIFISDYFSRK